MKKLLVIILSLSLAIPGQKLEATTGDIIAFTLLLVVPPALAAKARAYLDKQVVPYRRAQQAKQKKQRMYQAREDYYVEYVKHHTASTTSVDPKGPKKIKRVPRNRLFFNFRKPLIWPNDPGDNEFDQAIKDFLQTNPRKS